MFFVEMISLSVGYYIFWALGMYAFMVLSHWSMFKEWRFKIIDGQIGIYKCPKFFFWFAYKKRGNIGE